MKSRYRRHKVITTTDGKKILSMHDSYKKIDVTSIKLVPVKVDESSRLDIIAHKYLGDGRLWWVIAYVNNIFWSWNIKRGSILLVPENPDDILDYF